MEGGKVTSGSSVLGSEARIKAIPLCVSPQVDFLYWAREQDGVYSMKSGYKSICEDARNEEASASNSAAATDLWSGIWKLNSAREDKEFSLPTKENLLKRKIVSDSLCHWCGRCNEDTKHALWDCEVIKRVWCTDFSWVNQFKAGCGDFLDLVGCLLSQPRVTEMFATTA
nr:hypothetical protein CFP56_72277 [Quercus suber]